METICIQFPPACVSKAWQNTGKSLIPTQQIVQHRPGPPSLSSVVAPLTTAGHEQAIETAKHGASFQAAKRRLTEGVRRPAIFCRMNSSPSAICAARRCSSPAISKLDLLTGGSLVARLAEPSTSGESEWAAIFVAEERSRLMAPVASHHVRIPEIRIRTQDVCGHLFLVVDQIVAAKHLFGCRSNDLSHRWVLIFLGML